MIKLRNILFNERCLTLAEDNSGYTDYKLHTFIADKMFNCWLELLDEVEDKNNTIESIDSNTKNYFKKQIDDGNFFTIDLNDPVMNIYSKQRIDVLLAFEKLNDEIVINRALTNLYSKPIGVCLSINPSYSIKDVIKHKTYIENLANHEAVHIIKFIQKVFQVSMKGNEKSYKEQKWYNKYLARTQELHAYTSQLNNELKHLKIKYPDITFSNALKSSKIFQRYERGLFYKNAKLRSKMLSKLANYWNKL